MSPHSNRLSVARGAGKALGARIPTTILLIMTLIGTVALQDLHVNREGISPYPKESLRRIFSATSGVVGAWGAGDAGGLGDGGLTNKLLRVQAGATSDTESVVGGGTTYAIQTDGTVLAWGRGDYGQMGNGTQYYNNANPQSVPGLTNVDSMAASDLTAYALLSNGTVYAWGRNIYGEVGDSTNFTRDIPVQILTLSNVVEVAAGGGGTGYALKADGTVWGWGRNDYGQVGDGTTTNVSVPVQVSGLTNVIHIAGGAFSGYAVKNDGTVRAWGYNGDGQLGNGSTTSSSTPVTVSGLTGVKRIAHSGATAFALLNNGTLKAWGYGGGALGNGSYNGSTTPVMVPGITDVQAVSGSSTDNGYALKRDGSVWAWGSNQYGQLGTGNTTDSTTPVRVQYVRDAIAIGTGNGRAFAVIKAAALGPVLPREHLANGNLAESDDGQPSFGEPVGLANGNFWETVEDLKVPGRGIPLNFTRSYDSTRAGENGRLGYGWTDSYDWTLTENAGSGNVTIKQDNGSLTAFTNDGSGGYNAPSRTLADLVHNGDGTWLFTIRKTTKYRFTSVGQLSSITDLNNYVTSLTYNGSGRLQSIADPAGRQLTFTYDPSDRIKTVQDPLSRVVTFAYSTAGEIETVTNADGKILTYGYDSGHRMTTDKDPRNNILTNTYDPSSGRITSQQDRRGKTTTYDYTAPAAVDGSYKTTVTRAKGNKDEYTFVNANLRQVIRGLGSPVESATTYNYDPVTNQLSDVTDGNGETTSATYDSAGNKLTSTDPLNRRTEWTYNSLNLVLTEKDPLGVTTTNTYDSSGNILSTTRPLNGTSPLQSLTTSYTYGDLAHPGDVTKITNANGKFSASTFDSNGNLASLTDKSNRKTTYAYNVIGWRTSSTSPAGNATGGVPSQHTTVFSNFTGFGRPKTVTDQLGRATLYGFDANQNSVSVTDPDGRVTSSTYNEMNQELVSKRPDLSTERSTSYDDNGNVQSQANGLSNSYTFTYDALDRKTSSTDPLGKVTSYSYDKGGNLSKVVQQGSGSAVLTTTMTYDGANQLLARNYSDGATPNVTYQYDVNGRRASMTDGTGTTSYSWDSLNRLTERTNGAGQTVKYGYDLAGSNTSITYPNNSVVTRAFDDEGRLTSVKDWNNKTTTFRYDQNGNYDQTSYPNTVVGTRTYNRADALTAVSYVRAGTTNIGTFSYTRSDADLVSTFSPSAGAPGASATYSYTGNGQLKSLTGPSATNVWSYDNAGRLTKTPSGMTLGYNTGDQLTSMTPGSGSATAYTYDNRGSRLTSKVGTATATTFTYNQERRLTSYKTPSGGTSLYAYDGDGLRASKTPSGSTKKSMTWDTAQGGEPLLISDGTNYYIYGPDGSPVEQLAGSTATYLHADQLNSTSLLTNASGTVVGSYSYDPYGKATASGTVATPLQFNGQYVDSESSLIYLRARYYDPASAQFLSKDPLVSYTGAAYSYANGNPLTFTDPSGLVSVGICGNALAGLFVGLTFNACLVGAFDDRDGGVSVGYTLNSGFGFQLPGAISASGSLQLTTAREVQQLDGDVGSGWYMGAGAGEGLGLGVDISGSRACGAPGNTVVGLDVQLRAMAAFPVPAEVHQGVSTGYAKQWHEWHPFGWLR